MTAYPSNLDQRFDERLIEYNRRINLLEMQLAQALSVLSLFQTQLTTLGLSVSKPSSGILTLSTSVQDVPGTSLTFSVTGAHSLALVVGTFDFEPTVSSVGIIAIGVLSVDGSVQSQQAIWTDNGADSREAVTQSWMVTSLAAGSHTFKLRASKTGAAGTHIANATHTNMSVLIFDRP